MASPMFRDSGATGPNATPSRTSSPLVTRETTPSSLVIKLHLPAQRLRDLVLPHALSAPDSIQSSPPPSSPVASVTATDIAKPVIKKKASGKAKKPRMVMGDNGKPVEAVNNALAGPRLGPKSNAGVINENLRNLDRSGKSCRRWQQRAISLRTLYGGKWRCLSWTGESSGVA